MTARILLVDDDTDFREAVALGLQYAGYEVLEADNGVRALTVIDHLRPNLLLVDVNMPIMSGPELIEELARRGDQAPFGVIAMSGSIDAHSSPSKWFLAKPIELALLLGVVADFCGQRGTSPLWVQHQQRDSLEALASVVRAAG